VDGYQGIMGLFHPLPCNQTSVSFDFVNKFVSLAPRMANATWWQRDAFRYWSHLLQALQSYARIDCALTVWNDSWSQYVQRPSSASLSHALHSWISLLGNWSVAASHQLNYADSTGDLGSLMNMQSHNAPFWLQNTQANDLLRALGGTWPANATLSLSLPSTVIPRLIVPVIWDIFPLTTPMLQMRVHSLTTVSSIEFFWRRAGSRSPPTPIKAIPIGRNVFEVRVNRSVFDSNPLVEYYVAAQEQHGLRWPGDLEWQALVVEY
jgi:hypothetical protein